MSITLERTYRFCASHRYWRDEWTPAQNQAAFGRCALPHGHGHNYVIEVSIEGEPDPVTGMIVDLKVVKDVISSEVIDQMDHRHLNHEVPPFDRVIPTAENIAIEIWKRLKPALSFPNARLCSIRLYETDDLYVDYSGEE